MKTRMLITLLLFALIALPVFAQSNSSSNTQPAAPADQTVSTAPATATGEPPLKREPHDFWDGDEPGLGWLILHPFASKDYVKRNLAPIQDRLDELDALTTSGNKMVKDVDTRAQQGIQLASTKTKVADEHALEATNKAQQAHETATTVNTHVATVETTVAGIDQYNSASQAEIRFRPGQTVLSKQAKNALDQIATPLKDQHGYVIEVQGYATGSRRAAMANSRKMADAVQRYLVLNHEIPAYRIYVIGLGNAPAANGARGTRVEVSVLKNDLEAAK
jgi:outer membrane protein OmpA-like peptidoglycan-associated protein